MAKWDKKFNGYFGEKSCITNAPIFVKMWHVIIESDASAVYHSEGCFCKHWQGGSLLWEGCPEYLEATQGSWMSKWNNYWQKTGIKMQSSMTQILSSKNLETHLWYPAPATKKQCKRCCWQRLYQQLRKSGWLVIGDEPSPSNKTMPDRMLTTTTTSSVPLSTVFNRQSS